MADLRFVAFFSQVLWSFQATHWIRPRCDSSISETYGFRKPFACAFTCVNVPWMIFLATCYMLFAVYVYMLFHLSNLQLVQCFFVVGYQWSGWCEHGEPRQVSQCHYTDPNMPFANPSSQLCEEPCNASLAGEMYNDNVHNVSENIQYYIIYKAIDKLKCSRRAALRAVACRTVQIDIAFSSWNQIVLTSMFNNTSNAIWNFKLQVNPSFQLQIPVDHCIAFLNYWSWRWLGFCIVV